MNLTSGECQKIYLNMMVALKRNELRGDHQTAITYIRALGITDQCDRYHDLTNLRRDISDAIGTASMNRITNYNEKNIDRNIGLYSVSMNRLAHKEKLLSTLTWSSRMLWYNRLTLLTFHNMLFE